MGVWIGVAFVIATLGVIVFGYFLMTILDKFLAENRKAMEHESETKAPSCIMLTEELSVEEIVAEVKRFREKHEGARIVLYDSADTELSERIEYHTE